MKIILSKDDFPFDDDFMDECTNEFILRNVIKNLNQYLEMRKNSNAETRRKQELLVEIFGESNQIELEESYAYDMVNIIKTYIKCSHFSTTYFCFNS